MGRIDFRIHNLVRNDFATDRPLNIGRFVNGFFYFQGQMDDFRIYSRQLTPAEVTTIAAEQ